jgi:hypothetical protein
MSDFGNCLSCGKELSDLGVNHCYDCRRAVKTILKDVMTEPIDKAELSECLECHKAFKPKHRRDHYCSRKCKEIKKKKREEWIAQGKGHPS